MTRAAVWILTLTLTGLLGLSTSAQAGDAVAAEASFQKFARGWVADMERQAQSQRSGAVRYVAYDPQGVELSLKPTGNDAAPFVGTLTYTEITYQCQTPKQKSCQQVGEAPVTEIFPYQGGRWRY